MSRSTAVSVTIPSDLLADVDRIARDAGMTRSAVFAEALSKRRWLWRLGKLQKKAGRYAASRGIKSEADLTRFLSK